MRSKTWFWIISLPLALFAFYRAYTLDFTNDEAYSFKLIDDLKEHFTLSRNLMVGTANTHWLNSVFLLIEHGLLGHQEWMLRIHSVMALFVFIYALIHLFYEEQKPGLIFLPLTLILLNNYVFDFFSLARGYAWMMALASLAMVYIVQNRKEHTFKIYSLLALAVFANYTAIYLLLAYSLTDAYYAVREEGLRLFKQKAFYQKRIMAILVLLWAIPNLYYIKFISKDLEEGLRHGFIRDTIGQFIERSFNTLSYPWIMFTAGSLVVFVLFFYVRQRKQMLQGWRLVFEVWFLMILMIHGLFYWVDVPFPNGRTSLFMIIPGLILLNYGMLHYAKKVPPVLSYVTLSVLFIGNLFYCMQYRNPRITVEWWRQQGMKACIENLYRWEGDALPQRKIVMSREHFGVYENYYRRVYSKPLPTPINVYPYKDYLDLDSLEEKLFLGQDYLFMLGNYQRFLDRLVPPNQRSLMVNYPDMQTDVWKMKKP